ncbi:MAG: hypothetical protein WBC18_26265 [Ottowia sp.]|uniref:hypothetical protein n=1 Tax=unclassified Ottowia TaxID=2645081 RepID=UPI003C2B387D
MPLPTRPRLAFLPPILALMVAASSATPSFAQMRGQPPSPPPEAYTACEGKAEGASVTLTMPDGKTLAGTCRTLDGKLVAMPAKGPGAGGPPPMPAS